MQKKKQTIYVDGATIGFQFNKKSMGHRTLHLSVDMQNATVYIPEAKRRVRVRPLAEGNTHHWEVY